MSEKPQRLRSAFLQLRRNGYVLMLTFFFAAGLLFGSLYAKEASGDFLTRVDFLFTTNLESRLNQPVFSTFAASFASDFVFLVFVFLCGFAPWGMVVVPFAPAFKGFGTGLSAGYLFITYGFKGAAFYFLVVLGGTFVFTFALIMECVQAQKLSACTLKLMISAESSCNIRTQVRTFLYRSLYLLLLTCGSALVDMFLWSTLAKLFFS